MQRKGARPRAVRLRWLVGAVAVVVLAGCETDDAGGGDAGDVDDVDAVFDPDPECFGIDASAEVECGRVEVPLHYDDPDGETVELAVAVLPAARGEEREQPMVILGGGPGLQMVEPMLTDRGLRSHYDVGSELIVLDQRGVGASDPALQCREAMEVAWLTAADRVEAPTDALRDCRDRLVADGVDLDGFNHLANADDVEVVRRALGHDRVDVEGTSYGSFLALLVAERYPEGIRSLMLTSPSDPSRNFLEGVGPGFEQALDRIGEVCSDDPGCAEQIGDVDAAIQATVDRLDAQPEEVTVTRSEGESMTIIYDPVTFLDSLFALFYSPAGVARLPALVDAAEAGDLEPLALIAAEEHRSAVDSTAFGMQLSMLCSGEGAEFAPEQSRAEVQSEVIEEYWLPTAVVAGGEATARACEVWDVEHVAGSAEFSVNPQVPALIVTGTFDHVTPPQNGERIHDTLATSHLVEVPTAGHAPFQGLGSCARGIMAQFLDEPDTAPDDGCATERDLLLRTRP